MKPPTPHLLGRLLFSLVALSVFFLPAAVRADDPPVAIGAGAGADWGVKQSFRNYVTGPIAHGTISVADGASQNPDGTFHFPVAAGEYDPTTGTTVLGFTGTVHFEGHEGSLEVTISDPRVELTPEGSVLYADMASKPNQPGAPVTQYPNVKVADLDLSGKAPTVDATTTTWPALPSALANEAVPAFAGFYGAGTALDSFAFGYAGPGGVPQKESWTAEATPLWGKAVTGTIPTGVGRIAFDPARDRIWFGSYDFKKVVALNDETLASTGIDVSVAHNSRNLAIDPTSGAVYSVDTDIRAVRDGGSGFALDPTAVDTFSGGTNALATDPTDGTLYTVVENQLYRYRAAGGFARESFEIPSGYGAVQVTESGEIFLIPSGAPAVAELTISGSTATLDPIPGTNAVSGVAIAPDGRVAYVELDYSEYPIVHTTLHELTPDGSGGWNDREISGLSGVSNAYGVWSGDGKQLFLASSGFTDVIVVEDDTVVGRVKSTAYLSSVQPGPDGHVYALWRDGTIARLGVTATSPTITEQPDDASVTLVSAEATREVELTAAAEGDPAPEVRWQVRAPGSARWNDVEGASEATLAVEIGVEDSGARYRAIFGNEAGEIATVPALVSAQVQQPSDPGPSGPGGGDPAPPSTAPAAKPKIGGVAATRRVGSSRQVTVARLACPSGGASCRVRAPRKLTIRIDGEAFKLTVLAPNALAPGRSATLRVRLPKAAAERLAGGQATLRLKVSVGTPPTQTTRTIEVTLKKP